MSISTITYTVDSMLLGFSAFSTQTAQRHRSQSRAAPFVDSLNFCLSEHTGT